jgi:RNA polymerase sigma factor (sigma-70 family)
MKWPDCFDQWAREAESIAYRYVYRALRRIDRNDEHCRRIAQEAVQEAYLTATRRKSQDDFPVFAAFVKWMQITAERDAMKIYKSESKQAARIVPIDPAWCGETTRQPDAVEDALRECLDTLDDVARQIVHWRFWEDLTLAEIAELLEKKAVSTPFNRLREAIAKLRKCMASKLDH